MHKKVISLRSKLKVARAKLDKASQELKSATLRADMAEQEARTAVAAEASVTSQAQQVLEEAQLAKQAEAILAAANEDLRSQLRDAQRTAARQASEAGRRIGELQLKTLELTTTASSVRSARLSRGSSGGSVASARLQRKARTNSLGASHARTDYSSGASVASEQSTVQSGDGTELCQCAANCPTCDACR